MAITPWSWTASNGTATAVETARAYSALIGKLNTSNFSYKVWNDLISKIYTVNYTLGRSWNTEYATYPNTRASRSYDELSAARFNSARLNTHYPSWRWAYDENNEGYIGRTDMRGVAQFGENGADTVFGVYILELVERLNTVIGIINGTQDTVEMSESAPVIFIPETELIKLSSAPFDSLRQRMRLRISPTLTSENLPTLTLHYRIPTALFRAILELESIASQLEGNLRHSINPRGTLGRASLVTLSQSIRAGSSVTAHLRALPVGAFTGSGSQELIYNSRVHSFPSASFRGLVDIRHSISGSGIALRTASIGWHHVRIIMEPDSTLVQERKQTAESIVPMNLSSNARFVRSQSSPIIFSGSAGTMVSGAELSVPETFGLNIHHDVSTVQHSAEVNLVKLMESLKTDIHLDPLRWGAVLDKEHVSTMLEALLSSAVLIGAEPEVMITGSMEKHIEILLDLPVTLSGGDSIPFRWNIPILLENTAEAHVPQTSRLQWRERIKLGVNGKANVPAVASIEVLNQTVLEMSGTISRDSRSVRFSAHGRNGHNITGEMNNAHSTSFSESLNIPLPTPAATLDKYGLAPVIAGTISTHDIDAELGATSDISAHNAELEMSITEDGNLGYITYASMTAGTSAVVILNADIETKGGWQYPVIIGTDAAIYQVWLTEQCRNHLYLDPFEAVHHLQINNTTSAGLDYVINAGMERELGIHIAVLGKVNTVRRSDWECPVKTDENIYVPQALYTRPAGQYKLEVL